MLGAPRRQRQGAKSRGEKKEGDFSPSFGLDTQIVVVVAGFRNLRRTFGFDLEDLGLHGRFPH